MRPTRTGPWVAALCGLAFVRVLLLAAVFPPFNNVDEVFHYDVVVKAAAGEFAVRMRDARVSPATRETVALYATGVTMPQPGLILIHNSPEYMNPRPAAGLAPPVWTASPLLQAAARDQGRRQWDQINYLAVDPPLYYAIAGVWHRAGRAMRIAGGHLFYWTRAMDALAAAALVWVTWCLARDFFSRGSLVRFGAPLLVALFPQDTMHAVSSDVLAPLAFGAACYALLRFAVTEEPSVPLGAVSGLAVAAALLTKGTSEAIFIVALMCVAVRIRESGRGSLPAVGALVVAAAMPVAAWMLRFALAGVPGAASQKLTNFGWTPKPFGALWDHPVFTYAGARSYLEQGLGTFWRGEVTWHKAMLVLPALEHVYILSSVVLLTAATVRLVTDRGRPRLAGAACLAGFGLSVAWLVALSIAFTFPPRVQLYPTPAFPFLSWRLLIVALVPFAIAYMAGLEAVLRLVRLERYGRVVVVALVAGVTVVELWLIRAVPGSPYNWFALLLSRS